MYDDWKELIATEMQRDLDAVMDEIESDPAMKDIEAPEEMYDNVMAMIDEHEKQKIYEQLSDEDKELIQLGKVYKKQRKFDKFVVALAAVIVGLGIGSVCIGEDKNILRFMKQILTGGEQSVSDTGKTEITHYDEEEELYEAIEKEYGFIPVKFDYLPADTSFKEAAFGVDMQGISMYYVKGGKTYIIYTIRPNYRESSFAMINEDEKIQEYTMVVQDVEISLTEYNIVDSGEHRWSLHWVHENVQYLLRIANEEQTEVEKIVNDLVFKF